MIRVTRGCFASFKKLTFEGGLHRRCLKYLYTSDLLHSDKVNQLDHTLLASNLRANFKTSDPSTLSTKTMKIEELFDNMTFNNFLTTFKSISESQVLNDSEVQIGNGERRNFSQKQHLTHQEMRRKVIDQLLVHMVYLHSIQTEQMSKIFPKVNLLQKIV